MTTPHLPQIAVVDERLCDACGLCLPLCPPAAIGMRREGLFIDDSVCTGCRKCIAPCPVGALSMVLRPGDGATIPSDPLRPAVPR